MLFATALGSVALALTAHQLKRRGRKRKQVTKRRESQKTVGIPEALLRTGRPSSLKRGIPPCWEDWLLDCYFVSIFGKIFWREDFSPFSGQFNGRQMMSPSTRSNDTMSGISSIAPSKHSSSSHSITSVSFKIWIYFCNYSFKSQVLPLIVSVAYPNCVFFISGQMRVPSSPNQSANPPTPWEAEPVVEESGAVEDANVENLYLMGRYFAVNHCARCLITQCLPKQLIQNMIFNLDTNKFLVWATLLISHQGWSCLRKRCRSGNRRWIFAIRPSQRPATTALLLRGQLVEILLW